VFDTAIHIPHKDALLLHNALTLLANVTLGCKYLTVKNLLTYLWVKKFFNKHATAAHVTFGRPINKRKLITSWLEGASPIEKFTVVNSVFLIS
jgi:hypothetical protein